MDDGQRILDAALGYLHLGMPEDAGEELDNLPPSRRQDPIVLRIRAHIHCQTHEWDSLREVSTLLTSRDPSDSQHWIWLAYATRRCRSITEAEGILLDALKFHPGEAMIHFNLACYAAQTGRIPLARTRLQEAIRIDPATATMAMDDPDLESLW